jgi:hypothetical protein
MDNPDQIERNVDALRLNGSYKAVIAEMECYARVCNVHSPLECASSRTRFYWVCIAESVFATKGDYARAIKYCSRVAVMPGKPGEARECFDLIAIDARVCLARVLLKSFAPLLRRLSFKDCSSLPPHYTLDPARATAACIEMDDVDDVMHATYEVIHLPPLQ